jgi:hypothetical protein
MEHTIPPNHIYETSYYHVVPAYLSLLQFASSHDLNNKWFCMLTDSCCPIISPKKFRYLFYKNYNDSLFSWKEAWWNPQYHQRGNLIKLPKELWLANDPWFILTLKNVKQIIHFINHQQAISQTICNGGLANETLFAVIFKLYKELDMSSNIRCVSTHIADWNRRSSTTSPHVFKEGNESDITFINKELERNKFSIFIRKVAKEFPDEIIRHYINDYDKENDDKFVLIEPMEFIFNRYSLLIKKSLYVIIGVYIIYFWFFM